MLEHYNLAGTAVEDQYKGAGYAFLVVENGEFTKLIYENPECPPVAKDLSEDEILKLFIENSVDFYELEKNKGKIYSGMCSCFQFVLPEVVIDTETESE
ncbi:hypothetical protein [Halalkalibacter krulwichiae]|uniref:Uncharacterized protein n=1 Tax=Halalkalibacter krulwichiae TaxID=199441 RepID=A0A1X9MEJ1_9BACI|nr:hypothetical protein [Halalkalibacter krulwichiae]ARK31859.1 hypothetical protein BkAM31D_19580 [Halalkalibacter krulwichiae]